MEFSKKIIDWYIENKRDLPWRNTQNPYYIWISEIILQQTRVDQGLPYYEKYISHYPVITALANAPEDEVMKLWQGLGYYSRARNMHATAKMVTEKYNGVFPDAFEEILQLKGVGEYTAAAIASFAYNLPHPVVDGNVFRVLSRFLGIETPIDSVIGKKEFLKAAEQIMDRRNPGLYNQAIMEFGALHCKPQSPLCATCPINTACYAFQHKCVDSLPVKAKRLIPRDRYFNYLYFVCENNFFIKKRTAKDIWANLYDFPLIESKEILSEEAFFKSEEFKTMMSGCSYKVDGFSHAFKHQLTHQTLHATFYVVNLQQLPGKGYLKENCLLVERSSMMKYSIPRLIERFLDAVEKEKSLLALPLI